MELNQEFLIETFYSYCKRPIHKRYQNVYNAECPICKEGKSTGRSRRLFYFPAKQYFFCHNCSKSWQPFEWVKEVTTLTVPEILRRSREKAGDGIAVYKKSVEIKPAIIADLPEDSIDLTDLTQVEFFRNNKFVKLALEYIQKRKLLTAVNTCKKFYISLTDRVHKNRLVIPFVNNNQVVCYQTRALTLNQTPKYLTKFGEKELFGLSNIDSSIPYVFVFEGPIDSMFVKNGVALASLSPTEKQLQQLTNLIGYELIYVLDNDKNNKQTARKLDKFIKEGKRIFTWPKQVQKFKDFNEICTTLDINEISWKFVVDNSAKGNEAVLKIKVNKIK